jgi:hypothetical protein
MDDEELMKITVVIYKNGLFTVMCEGDEVDCKIISYGIKTTLDTIGYIARALIKALIEEIARKVENKNRSNDGTM